MVTPHALDSHGGLLYAGGRSFVPITTAELCCPAVPVRKTAARDNLLVASRGDR